jgi:hypothetical protein
MKTIKLSLVIVLLQCFAISAIAQTQEMSQAARSFKTNLMSFLREEGYTPTTESTNSNTINFKREGEAYWITLSGSRPVQVTMHINGFTNKDANGLALLIACNEVNKELYYVKVYVDDFGDDGSTNIAIEIPAHTAEDFRYVFADCAKALAQARNNIQDSYNKNKESLDESNQPFKVTGCSVGNEDKNGKIITDFGNTIYSYNTRYLKPQLTIQSEKSGTYTIYYKLYTPNGTLSTGTSSPSGYSTSSTINVKAGTYTYKLSGWGADTAGHWKSGNYKYEFYCNGASLGYYEFTIK